MSHLNDLSKLLDSPKAVVALSPQKNKSKKNKQPSPLYYQPYGACGTVTGSAHFVYHTYSDKWIAVDCGLLQGEGNTEGAEFSQSAGLPVQPRNLHALFLTHAHADHVGQLIYWLRDGFRGKIYCTDVTAKLTLISLQHNLNRLPPIDGDGELMKLLPSLFVCPDRESSAAYGRAYQVDGVDGLRYAFTPTSHLIGCVAIRIVSSGSNQPHADIVFSADVGPVNDDIAHGGLTSSRTYPISISGVIVLESTYGDREARDPSTLQADSRLSAMANVIQDSVTKGPEPRLIVPAFSLGRTTDLLADLFIVLATKRETTGLTSDAVPVINIDSQLAARYAEVLREAYAHRKGTGEYSWMNPHSRLIQLGGLPLLQRLFSAASEPYQLHNTPCGKIIVNWGAPVDGSGLSVLIAGSGTTIFGQVCREIMQQSKNPQATVLYCGYCPETSMGAHLRNISRHSILECSTMKPLSMRLADGENGAPRYWQVAADAVKINVADLLQYYSGHADSSSLKQYLESINKPVGLPLHVILVHGTNKARAKFAKDLKELSDVCEVHCPSALYPLYDVYNKRWMFTDLGELRSSMRLHVKDKNGETPTVAYVAKAIMYSLSKSFNIPKVAITVNTLTADFSVGGMPGLNLHKVTVSKAVHGDFLVRVNSAMGACQSNEEFKARCFPWGSVTGFLDPNVELGYKPVGTEEEALSLVKTINDPARDYPILIVTKLGDDNTCAKFLAKSLMLESGLVRLVTVEGRNYFRELGLDVHSGKGIFYDECPGSPPHVFSILNPLDSAPAFLACLNRIEDTQRNSLPVKLNYTESDYALIRGHNSGRLRSS